jgi:anti-sigma factor RsiW
MSESGRIPDTHAEAWTLLPWLVNGRISDEDREWVAPHVAGCDECRREVEAQRAIAGQMRDEPLPQVLTAERSFGKLWTRIEAAEGAVPANDEVVVQSATRRGPSRTVRWLAAAVVVQAVGLATLGLAAWNGGSGDFRTVTDEPAVTSEAPAIRLVFDPGTSVGTMNEVLDRHGLKIVSGPGSAGQFTAALTGDATPESVAVTLSGDPHVRFAQPVAQ